MREQSPKTLEALSREALLERAKGISWYHRMDLGGYVTPGTFDIAPVLRHYGFPDDMKGLSVLDVGRASGFFSFEFERRGARVTATELPHGLFDKEYVGGQITRSLIRRWFQRRVGDEYERGDREDFLIAHRLLDSKVVPVSARISDLSPELFGGKRFDLVFVGSVLIHVKDPAGSLERIYSVTGGQCIVANPIDADDRSHVPKMRLVGLVAGSLTGWWLPNLSCLVELMRTAGFQDVHVVSRDLVLKMQETGKGIPHAVVHGWRRSDVEVERAFAEMMKTDYPGIEDVLLPGSSGQEDR